MTLMMAKLKQPQKLIWILIKTYSEEFCIESDNFNKCKVALLSDKANSGTVKWGIKAFRSDNDQTRGREKTLEILQPRFCAISTYTFASLWNVTLISTYYLAIPSESKLDTTVPRIL